MKIGCHVSIAGGVFNAPKMAHDLGCEVYQIFTRSPQGGPAPKWTKETLAQFRDANEQYGFSEWVVHTPYFINFASTNNRIRFGSASIVREELERGTLIGAKYLMTHLGSGKDVTEERAHRMACEGIAKALDGYRGTTKFCIELSAGAGHVLGNTFEEISRMIHDIEKGQKALKGVIGVCLDTCHAFASGYDLRDRKSINATLKAFDEHIGLERLWLLHGNDSKFGLGEHKDRHEHIGDGQIGREGFAAIVNHPKLKTLNLYLETEHDKVKADIKLLKRLRT